MSPRVARALLVLGLVLAVLAPPAAALPLLDAGDAAELAQSLADASEEQGVCYGWNVQVADGSGGPSGFDSGSHLGPGRPVGASVAEPCERTVVLEGLVSFTCDSCEGEDSASVRVVSSFPGGPTTRDLERLGLKGGDLAKDDGDVTLVNMVGALPLLVSGRGLADPVPVEPSTVAPAASDRPTNSPAIPDWLRDRWLPLCALLLLVGGGVAWLLQTIATERSRDARRRRAEARAGGTSAAGRPPPVPAAAARPSDPTP